MPAGLLPAGSASVCLRVCSPQAEALETIERPWPRPWWREAPLLRALFLHSAEESGSALGGSTGCATAGEVGRGGSACVVCSSQMGRLRRSPAAEVSQLLLICWALRMPLSL